MLEKFDSMVRYSKLFYHELAQFYHSLKQRAVFLDTSLSRVGHDIGWFSAGIVYLFSYLW